MADSLFNRPPSISEDTLQYAMYLQPESSSRTQATTITVAIQAFVDSALTGFIWHRDPFQIKVVQNQNAKDTWMLEGRMRVGDSIDDEWCIVWLLREISAKWDLVIRCAIHFSHSLDSYSHPIMKACMTLMESSCSSKPLIPFPNGFHLPTLRTGCALNDLYTHTVFE